MFIMVRPIKHRFVESKPVVIHFKPNAVPLSELEENNLTFDELEAFKLKFLDKFEQESAAKKMRISRTTFWRILNSAGEKIADALINEKAIRIEGGAYEIIGGEVVNGK